MKTTTRATIVTVVMGLAALGLFPVVWPPHDGAPVPIGIQFPLLVFLTLIESLLLGAGIALLLFGRPLFQRLPGLTQKAQKWTFVSFFWLLASWWPHIGLHVTFGEQMWAVIGIDYGFHLTVMIATVIVLRSIMIIVREYAGAQTGPGFTLYTGKPPFSGVDLRREIS